MLLGDTEVDVAHQQVSLRLHKVTLLQIAADIVCTDLSVVHLRGAATCLIGSEKLKETVAVLTLCLLVHINDCLVHIVTQLLYVLV